MVEVEVEGGVEGMVEGEGGWGEEDVEVDGG